MRYFWVVLAVWLAIGALAAGQRHYYSSSSVNCSGFGTIVVNIAFGPVNYLGANPKLTCHLVGDACPFGACEHSETDCVCAGRAHGALIVAGCLICDSSPGVPGDGRGRTGVARAA